MRIIAGTAKGRKLFTPAPGRAAIRPTADRAREALFSILGEAVAGAGVLDLFAGTGAMGLEALSRGGDTALFVDYGSESLDLIRRNIAACGVEAASRVLKRDLQKGLAIPAQWVPAGGFSLVFIDPPYRAGLGMRMLVQLGNGLLLAPGALLVVEDDAREIYPDESGKLQRFDHRRYGEAGFWLYSVAEEA